MRYFKAFLLLLVVLVGAFLWTQRVPFPPEVTALRQQAEKGDPDAADKLGDIYSNGYFKGDRENPLGMAGSWVIKPDPAKAVEWWRKAAEGGNAAAASSLLMYYTDGFNNPQNPAEAIKWWGVLEKSTRTRAEKGDADAELELGDLYRQRDEIAANGQDGATFAKVAQEDQAQAIKWWSAAADAGNADAAARLGKLYSRDLAESDLDYPAAYFWYSLAWKNDKSSLASDRKDDRDEVATHLTPAQKADADTRVKAWVEKRRPVAEHEEAIAKEEAAMNDLRSQAERGDKKALAALQAKARLGDARAQSSLGEYYQEQAGDKPELALQAEPWLRKAAEQQDAVAQFLLGDRYAKGLGVKQDDAEAYFWYSLAIKNDPKSARNGWSYYRDDMANHLTFEQKAAADSRVADWFEAHAATSKPSK